MEKAFDCVNHDILLYKLEFFRGRDKLNGLIKSYLKNRYQSILMESKDSYQNIFSHWEKVKHGSPLISIIGPLLFHFYINDVQKSLKLTLNQSSLQVIKLNYYESHSIDFKNNISTGFVQLNECFNANALFLNHKKTHYMHFVTKSSSLIDIAIGYNKGKR